MSEPGNQFDLLIMDPDRVIFEGKVNSLFVKGDTGEFEILPFHYPVLSVLTTGNIVVNWKYKLPVRKGILRFFMNQCVVVVELNDEE